MNVAHFIWEKLRLVNRIPGMYTLWQQLTNLRYRDGAVVTLKNGPASGLRWRHYRGYQPWMAMGLYEPHVAQLICDQLQPGDNFYDIGANAGYFTLIAATKVGLEGAVVSFDPLPRNVRTVREQIDLNHLEGTCRVEQVAVSNKCGHDVLVVPVKHSTANAHLESVSLSDTEKTTEQLEVETVTLDSYVAAYRELFPTLIKIDIEGAEIAALQGAHQLLQSANAPYLLVSTHSQELKLAARQILKDYRYTFHHLAGFQQMIFALPPQAN